MAPIKIVVIEDEFPILEELIDFLELKGFQAYGAGGGVAGLEAVHSHQPDLVICDVMMPDMDGFEVLEHLRNHSSTASIPFVFLTARADMQSLREGMKSGADDYLTKPFLYNDLLTAIYARLERKQQQEKILYKSFAQRLIRLQESEKQKIADYLRQELSPNLAGAKLTLKVGQEGIGGTNSKTLDELSTLIQKALDHVEQLSNELSPELINHVGLIHIILWRLETLKEHSSIRVKFTHHGIDSISDQQVKLGIYRILSDLFSNLARSGDEQEIHLDIRTSNQLLTITVDIFDLDADLQLSGNGTMDWMFIEEYVNALDGEIDIIQLEPGLKFVILIPTESKRPSKSTPATLPQRRNAKLNKKVNTSHKNIALLFKNTIFLTGLKQAFEQYDRYVTMVLDPENDDEYWGITDIQPEVVILDANLLAADKDIRIGEIKNLLPLIKVIIVTGMHTISYAYHLFNNQVDGIVSQLAQPEEYAQAIDEVLLGNIYIGLPLTETDLRTYTEHIAAYSEDIQQPLTPRETEILELILAGNKTKEIALDLGISPRTTETHRTNLMRKFAVNTQVDLVRIAIERGYKPYSN